MEELKVPNYQLQTQFGERLQKQLKQPQSPVNGQTKATMLATTGVMGTMPGRYNDYSEEFVALLSRNSGVLHNAVNRHPMLIPEDAIRDDDVSPENVLSSVRFNQDLMDLDDDDDDDEDLEMKSDTLLSGCGGKNPRYVLPLKWTTEDDSPLLVTENGLRLKLDQRSTGSTISKAYDVKCAKSDLMVPIQCGVFYYEIKITNVTNNNRDGSCDVSLGFMTSHKSKKAPGLEIGSYGFNGSDGNIYANHSINEKYNKPFGLGDVIGCGVDFHSKTIFFTKNGILLGSAFNKVFHSLYCVVGMKEGNGVLTNFGQYEFLFNIEGYVFKEKSKILLTIMHPKRMLHDDEDTGELDTDDKDDQIANKTRDLVASYLDHLGYVDVSKTFAHEISQENDVESAEMADELSPEEEEILTIRQQIRNYLIQGNIDGAISLTNLRFPKVFAQNETILFHLNCCQFIQLIKRANIDEAIKFGQDLRTQLNGTTTNQDYLNDIFSLLAYEDPQESEFGYLLKDEETLKVCDELNGEILASLGKPRVSSLQEHISKIEEMREKLFNKDVPQDVDSLFITREDLGINFDS